MQAKLSLRGSILISFVMLIVNCVAWLLFYTVGLFAWMHCHCQVYIECIGIKYVCLQTWVHKRWTSLFTLK